MEFRGETRQREAEMKKSVILFLTLLLLLSTACVGKPEKSYGRLTADAWTDSALHIIGVADGKIYGLSRAEAGRPHSFAYYDISRKTVVELQHGESLLPSEKAVIQSSNRLALSAARSSLY